MECFNSETQGYFKYLNTKTMHKSSRAEADRFSASKPGKEFYYKYFILFRNTGAKQKREGG